MYPTDAGQPRTKKFNLQAVKAGASEALKQWGVQKWAWKKCGVSYLYVIIVFESRYVHGRETCGNALFNCA